MQDEADGNLQERLPKNFIVSVATELMPTTATESKLQSLCGHFAWNVLMRKGVSRLDENAHHYLAYTCTLRQITALVFRKSENGFLQKIMYCGACWKTIELLEPSLLVNGSNHT